eukprot:jgi/Chrzof1/8368/Cz03g08010.t1
MHTYCCCLQGMVGGMGGMTSAPYNGTGASGAGWQQKQPTMAHNNSGMSPCQAAVMAVLSDPSAGENGMSTDTIIAHLQGQYNGGEIQQALTFLTNEAHCYTTCDDNHYKAA